jgi:hypothetical protein
VTGASAPVTHLRHPFQEKYEHACLFYRVDPNKVRSSRNYPTSSIYAKFWTAHPDNSSNHQQHRKVLIFTSPVMRSRIADEAAKAGIPVTILLASILAADKFGAVEAFEKAEEGVLVASPHFRDRMACERKMHRSL